MNAVMAKSALICLPPGDALKAPAQLKQGQYASSVGLLR
jgi:hypothetical protein